MLMERVLYILVDMVASEKRVAETLDAGTS